MISKAKSILVNTKKVSLLAWIMCGLGALFYCYEYFLRIAPSVMSKELMHDYHLTAATFGNLTAYYYYIYTPMQIIVGVLMDRFGTRVLLTLACLICALGTYLFACSDIVLIAQIGRFLVGLGSAFAFVGALKLITLWLPEERFALGAGLITALGSLGAMTADIVLTSMVEHAGWRATNMIAAATGVVIAIVLMLMLRDGNAQLDKNQIKIDTNVKFSSIFNGLWETLKSPQIWKAGLVGGLLYMPTSAFAELWAIPYLEQAHGFSSHDAAAAVSMTFLGWAIGCPIVGYISDRIKRRLAPMLVGGLLCLGVICYILYVPHLSLIILRILFLFIGIFVSAQVVVFAVARESSRPYIGGTVIALTNMLVMVGGVIFQPVIGLLLDLHWNGQVMANGVRIYSAENFTFALSVLPIAVVLALIITLFIKETHAKLQE